MELHSQTAASKMWYYLRAVLFMLKVKSVVSKRKLIMDVNMFMKKGKLAGKSISNILTLSAHKHHNSHRSIKNPTLSSTSEYEFSSCHNDNSYNPHDLYVQEGKKGHRRGGNNYFACLSAPVEEGGEEQEAEIRTPLRLEYAAQDSRDLMTTVSPFDGRASDFSAVLEREGSCGSGSGGVDTEAEEFIRRFYEQLKKQREVGLLENPQSDSGEISESCE